MAHTSGAVRREIANPYPQQGEFNQERPVFDLRANRMA
jgi:hypothetical protein